MTPEHTTSFFFLLYVAVLAVLILTFLVFDYGIDWIVARWNARKPVVVDFAAERRRLCAVMQTEEPCLADGTPIYRRRRLSRQECQEGLADRGCDTWEEARGER